MAQVMSFQKWVDETMGGVAPIAKALGVSKAIIYRWYYGEGAPKAGNILDLVKLSKGKLTADSILRDTYAQPAKRASAKKAAAEKKAKKSAPKKKAPTKAKAEKKPEKKAAKAAPKKSGKKKAAPKKKPVPERQGAVVAPKEGPIDGGVDPLV